MRRHRGITRLVVAIPLLVLAVIFTATVPQKASAHVLEQDGDAAAVLHIAPDDNPVAGAKTAISLEFSSADPNFNLDNYEVDVSIQADNASSPTETAPLTPDGPASLYGTANVIFPSTGVYDIIARGTPNSTGKAFKLTYVVRVEQTGAGGVGKTVSSAAFDTAMICLASFGLLVIIARYQIIKGERYTSR